MKKTKVLPKLLTLAVLSALLFVTVMAQILKTNYNIGAAIMNPLYSVGDISTEPNLKVAFIGDTGGGQNFSAVLQLIKSEGATLIVHQGDIGYDEKYKGWVNAINRTLGSNFPYFMSEGNHDRSQWGDILNPCNPPVSTYANFIRCRLNSMNATANFDGSINRYSVEYKGLKLVFLGDPPNQTAYTEFINRELSGDNHTWKICSWHRNQRATNVDSEGDKVGWDPYEACRQQGAIVAQGHSHTYSRTKTLNSSKTQSIDTLCLDNPDTPDADVCVSKGSSFIFDSSIGGKNIRAQNDIWAGKSYWAKVYTLTQNAKFGALFIEFNVDGHPNKARAYFKNIANQTIDGFEIMAK